MIQLLNWLAMGGYARYIWPAYGLVFVVLLGNLFGIRWQRQKTRKKLLQWFKNGESARETSQT